jgi:type I restriction enzyme S subunit
MAETDIPSGWKAVPVGTIGEVVTGQTPPTANPAYWDGPIPFITPAELRGTVVLSTERSITQEGLRRCRALPSGSVLVSCIGYIGKVGVVGTSVAVTNQQINAVVPIETKADSWFLAYAFMHVEPRLRTSAGVTTVPILNKSNFEACLVPLPPLPEQRAIARVLRAVQAAREARQREVALERERKAALMQRLFTHGTRGEPTKQTLIGEMPESWEVTMFSEVAEFLQYGTSRECTTEPMGVPVLRIPNVIGGKVDSGDLKYLKLQGDEADRLRLAIGDILFVRTNGRREYTGRCAVYMGELDEAFFASYLIRARLKPNTLLPQFAQVYATTPRGSSYLAGRASNAADGKFNINTQTVNSVPLPQPPLDEQSEIVEVVTACEAKTAALERERALLGELFRALLEELMTGRVSVERIVERGEGVGDERRGAADDRRKGGS